MNLTGNGLNNGSHMYFYTPSQNAKKLLYYPVAVGDFYCNSDYDVVRESYDSILVILVLDGNLHLIQDGAEYSAANNEALIADCYRPHRYFTETNAHTLWIHFDGGKSRPWFDEIKQQKGQKIKCGGEIAEHIQNIMRDIKTGKNEYDISSELYTMLCLLSKPDGQAAGHPKAEQIKNTADFIRQNYDKDISVDELAKDAYMSASYFSKVFKENTAFSPYDYLLHIRLGKAKEMLLQTELSIGEIAYRSGFHSTSNFIYFFKKETGLSPLKFRHIMF